MWIANAASDNKNYKSTEHQLNDLTNVLHRSVEIAAVSGRSSSATGLVLIRLSVIPELIAAVSRLFGLYD
jgi:hypothetical protein